ncbi:hypothetical protein SEA_BLUEFEATHER_9 [Arthrobacter phage BlueFeather]|uniref:Minor tail protein n=1 Tax=Arthrobacter phage BlueFeather TaxID=2713258 RepID=A0A6G8R2B5_9CAUD|nr:hypothetical protein QEX68_gp09 [Arthrobacter phage BlueFeather]QIN94313.1 hypothetical protein SEA_BLUEFEATHER_9 [Arthrobacter phage BlueFeather]
MVRVAPSVESLRELQAVVLAVRLMGKDLRGEINKATRDTMNPVWKNLVQAKAREETDVKILVPGTRIAAGNPPQAIAASSSRRLSGGGTPKELARAREFGAVNRNAEKTYTRRNRSRPGSHTVQRHTQRQLPAATRTGRVVYPAFAELAPRMVSLWVQIVVRKTHEAFERGGRG